MKQLLLILTALVLAPPTFAHEGHDQTPGMIKTLHGGTALPGKEINLEYVTSGTDLKLYPLSHEGKDLTSSQVKITASTKAPKGKTESLKLEAKEGGFVGQVDFKKAYRLEVNVTAESAGHKDTFKFQMEK